MKAIYARYGSVEENDCQTLEEAKDFLSDLENDGQGYAICIYDEESRIAHVKENMEIFGRTEEDVFNEKMEIFGRTEEDVFNEKMDNLKELGIDPLKIEFFK